MSLDKISTHEDLVVWKQSIEFITDVYKSTSDYPKSEIYGLASQMRRAAVSIGSNIAEGAARKGHKEFIQFLYIALGSCAELHTQILVSKNLNYLSNNQLMDKLMEIKRMLIGLISSIEKKRNL